MPESLKLDFNQKEVCERVQRKAPQKNKNIFHIPNPKVLVPEEMISKKRDPEKEKKIQNIQKLKR